MARRPRQVDARIAARGEKDRCDERAFCAIASRIARGKANAKKLADAVDPFIDTARRIRRNPTSQPFRATQGRDLNAVRAWTRDYGHTVSDCGRVSGNILDGARQGTRIGLST
ncbi:Lsr2 family DNA-binding protein [Microbacterium testaceum]|uniref:Lsr2 family DNA-binding protein n=1 Tax=Microbacterium testaceum TaxID=2033 RepID=UPI0038FCF524